MITEKKAKSLMRKLIKLRAKTSDKPSIVKYKAHENLCIEQFKYVVHMHADRYKAFANYDDLVQEGYEALLKAMANYNPTKGSFFYWAHQYIKTRITRSANAHSVIRYPMKFAKENIPHKELNMPVIIETKNCADVILESVEIAMEIRTAVEKLDEFEKKIVILLFGIDDGISHSVSKVCRELKISRSQCLETRDKALKKLSDVVELKNVVEV